MCSVSAVIDHWREGWQPYVPAPVLEPLTPHGPDWFKKVLDQAEVEKLKLEIAEFRKILKRAREWDKAHQSDPCTETPEKIEALREIVRALGLEEEVEIVLKEVEDDYASAQ